MRNTFLDTKLAELGLSIVRLNVLHPDELTYGALFMQPAGDIKATPDGVENADSGVAVAKHSGFLQIASDLSVDLAMTPEYSCPWKVLSDCIRTEHLPCRGGLWVLGCESITEKHLTEFRNAQEQVTWIVAEFDPDKAKTFLDPLCYVFWARDEGGEFKLVVAIQFKGQPMSDHLHNLERDHMKRGAERFIIRNDNDSVLLTALICSDALNFKENTLPQNSHIPYLILHPQLNPKPRYNAFKEYRHDAYLRSDKPEFICLNWARGFRLPGAQASQFGGSAYYLKTASLPPVDDRLNQDHRRGLYYTISPDNQSHIFFFNYCEGLFYLSSTKASQAAAAFRVLQNRTGPQMRGVYFWDATAGVWNEIAGTDDGFSVLCNAVGTDLSPLSDAALSILDRERLLALSTGAFHSSTQAKWFHASQLSSFHVKDDEIVKRLTVVQDPDATAYEERFRTLSNFSYLRNRIIADNRLFPKGIADFAGSSTIQYPLENRYEFNLQKNDLSDKATVAYLGNCSAQRLNRSYDLLFEILDDPKDQVRDAQRRRLVVWYEQNGTTKAKWEERSDINSDLSEGGTSISKVL